MDFEGDRTTSYPYRRRYFRQPGLTANLASLIALIVHILAYRSRNRYYILIILIAVIITWRTRSTVSYITSSPEWPRDWSLILKCNVCMHERKNWKSKLNIYTINNYCSVRGHTLFASVCTLLSPLLQPIDPTPPTQTCQCPSCDPRDVNTWSALSPSHTNVGERCANDKQFRVIVLRSSNPPCISTVGMQGGFGDEHELQHNTGSETQRVRDWVS